MSPFAVFMASIVRGNISGTAVIDVMGVTSEIALVTTQAIGFEEGQKKDTDS